MVLLERPRPFLLPHYGFTEITITHPFCHMKWDTAWDCIIHIMEPLLKVVMLINVKNWLMAAILPHAAIISRIHLPTQIFGVDVVIMVL